MSLKTKTHNINKFKKLYHGYRKKRFLKNCKEKLHTQKKC